MTQDKDAKEYEDLKKFKEQMEKEHSNLSSPISDTSQESKDSKTLNDESHSTPEVIFNTHKFIYSLYHNGTIKGHKIEFTNRSGEEQTIEIDYIEIGASPISAKFYDTEGKRHIIPFLRIHKILFQGKMVWEGEEKNKDVKVIKGY